ncbi:MAG: diaminopimelate decarboxylase, partial [Candidatus Omnitrophica bacterium]|nr:diaminopimelate decarboxylase [Candidatus Omnitrophota bacterium]
MHDFTFKKKQLYCESVPVKKIADEVGTPVYIYSRETIIHHYLKMKNAFAELKPLICFSVKSNSNLAICRLLAAQGAGLDIVSGGELYRALKAGADPQKIVYAGVGKTREEIITALKANILFFNVESRPELKLINEIAAKHKKKVNVAIRINPDVDPKTHKYITTGKSENKFGLDITMAGKLFRNREAYPWLNITGVHLHIGSQITEAEPFVKAIKKIACLITELKGVGIDIEYLNLGGGLGIIYAQEQPQTAQAFAQAVIPLIKQTGCKLILEPGRFIVGNSGILATRVTYVKQNPIKRFIIVDAGMNDLMRPSLYQAYHHIQPVVNDGVLSHPLLRADVVGPICESADFLGKDRDLPLVQDGDLLAVMSAGAYGFSMSSNYNSRPRPAEVLVADNKYYIIRRKETYAHSVPEGVPTLAE